MPWRPVVFDGGTNLMRRMSRVSPGLLCAGKDIGRWGFIASEKLKRDQASDREKYLGSRAERPGRVKSRPSRVRS